jgi:ABC-2 type transport system permease protein
VVMLAVVAAAIVIPVIHHGSSSPGRETVGVVGPVDALVRGAVADSAKSTGVAARLVTETDLEAAKAGLRSGDLALVIINGQTLLVKKGISDTDSSTKAAFVHAVSTNLGVAEAFDAAGLSEAQSSAIAQARTIPIDFLEPGTTTSSNDAAQGTSVVGLVLVFLMLTQYNTWTLIGVMEEKASRVVEVLLAAVRPAQLLTGKVLGIGLVAFAQAAVIVAFALGLAKAVGSDVLNGTAPLVLVSTLVWLLLGYAFYCWVYAAAGSLTERQDQVQTLAFPLSLPIVFGYITALTATTAQHASTLIHVLAYLPPTAPFAMPVMVGLHAVAWWEFVISAAVSLLATIGMARLAVTIYRRAILRTGRVQLRDLLARTTAPPPGARR